MKSLGNEVRTLIYLTSFHQEKSFLKNVRTCGATICELKS